MLVALAAGGLFGSWAAFANHSLGAAMALHAGLTQAPLTTANTLVQVLVLERLFRWPSDPVRGFWSAILGTSTLVTACLVLAHSLSGTPNIAIAIGPSVIIGAAFNFAYARTLLAQAVREKPDCQSNGTT